MNQVLIEILAMAIEGKFESITQVEKMSAARVNVMQHFATRMLFILGARFSRLQVLAVDGYHVLGDENRSCRELVLATRGRIFDREGCVIVDSYPSMRCLLLRNQKSLDSDILFIATGLHVTVDDIQGIMLKHQYTCSYLPIPLEQDFTSDEQAFIEAHRNEPPELEIVEERRGLYPRLQNRQVLFRRAVVRRAVADSNIRIAPALRGISRANSLSWDSFRVLNTPGHVRSSAYP